MPKNFAVPMALQSIDVTTMLKPTDWYILNPGGLEGPALIVRFVNLSGVDITIGFGEQTAHAFLPADGEPLIIEFQRNNEPDNKDFLIKTGIVFWVQGDVGLNSGDIYLSGWLRSKD